MINEDMNQVVTNIKTEVFRDLRVCSQAVVVAVHEKQVDVQLTVADSVDGRPVVPPVIKNMFVVGDKMPSSGALGVVLHFDRRNELKATVQESGGPAHEIGFGVFLPIVT